MAGDGAGAAAAAERVPAWSSSAPHEPQNRLPAGDGWPQDEQFMVTLPTRDAAVGAASQG